MKPLQTSIRTYTPIFIPIELKMGVDRSTRAYERFKLTLHEQFIANILPRDTEKATNYESIEKDSWEHQLFIWQDTELAENLRIHVFPNNIGVVVIDHTVTYENSIKQLEIDSRALINQVLAEIYPAFLSSLSNIADKRYGDFFHFDSDESTTPEIFWVSRAIKLSSSDLSLPTFQALTRDWLAPTYRPQDADDIINQRKTYSMTWLNYLFVDLKDNNDDRDDCMVLAQYYYSAQERCNKLLKQAIDIAYNGNKHTDAQAKLSRSRVISRLHQVDFHEHLKYLTPAKRTMLEGVLAGWNYEQISENGQRMIEICSSKIEETEHTKRERSSLLTDLLLVALSFFTVFELSLYLTEFSREMMARPALDFNDDSRSFLLQFIAEIDTDVMFGSGFFLTLLLVFVYKFIKSR